MSVLFGNQQAVDPESLRAACAGGGVDPSPFWGKANAFRVRAGYEPSSGHILLTKDALDALTLTQSHTLTFVGADTNSIDLSPVTLLDRLSVLSGAPDDGAEVFVCTVVDRRHFMQMVPFSAGFAGYNVEAAAGGSYLSGTLNSGSAWTWQGVVNDLVTALGEDTAEFVLPFTPDGTPENLVFDISDVPGPWAALCRVLTRIGCVAVLDPTDDTFSVVRQGSGMTSALATLTGDADYLGDVWDGHAREEVRGWRPEKAKVLFPRRPQPTTGAAPYYAVDVTLSATTGVEAGTYVVLPDDNTADGATGTPSNSAALATRAQERADDWLRVRGTYDRPLVRAWRDFQRKAVGLVGVWADAVTYDDRGGDLRTWATQEPGPAMGDFRPLGKWPVWWPFTTGSSSVSAWKEPVRVATTANGTLSTAFANGQVVDGVTLATGDRILIKNQSTATQNGIYVVAASGAPTRATDADTGAELLGATVAVAEGTTNADTVWLCTANATITVGSTNLPWQQMGDVVGPSSAGDTTVAVFDGTSGKKIKDSAVTIDGSGNAVTGGSFSAQITGGFPLGGECTVSVGDLFVSNRFATAQLNPTAGLVFQHYSDIDTDTKDGYFRIQAVGSGSTEIRVGATDVSAADGALGVACGDLVLTVTALYMNGDPGVSGTRTVKDGSGTDQTVTIVNGIITGWTE